MWAYVNNFADSRYKKGNKCMKSIGRREKFGEGRIHTRKNWQLVLTAQSEAVHQTGFWYAYF
jgi:hypothetical protein